MHTLTLARRILRWSTTILCVISVVAIAGLIDSAVNHDLPTNVGDVAVVLLAVAPAILMQVVASLIGRDLDHADP